jgi:dihydrofolate reductase
MAKLVFGMNVSLDGYVDHDHAAFAHDSVLFRHWIECVRSACASVYGRRLYEIMRYWDEDQPGWTEAEHDFSTAWRNQRKWVVLRTLHSVGPNATLVSDDDVEVTIRGLKASLEGEIDVGGPELVQSLSELGFIDEYRLYFHPVVLGRGKPFFVGSRPRLRLVGNDPIGGVIRLTYVPA